VLTQRKPIQLTKPMKVPEKQAHAVGEITCDEVLFERLRALRKRLADERGVPSYIVFSDVSLRQMARFYPATSAEFARISGVGRRKLDEFGKVFMAEIAVHLQANSKQIFADESFELPSRSGRDDGTHRVHLNDTTRETLKLFRAGQKIGDIATRRMLAASTIYGHLATALEAGESIDISQLLTPAEQESIRAAFGKVGFGNLTGVHESLGGKFDFGLLRLCRTAQQRAA
jgi:ATP-dependent DNA helicase RecQ